MNITLDDFLEKFFDFYELCGSEEKIQYDNLKDNPPRKYRYLQLKSIMNAYNIGPVENFTAGSFTDCNKDPDKKEAFRNHILNDVKSNNWLKLEQQLIKSEYEDFTDHVPYLFEKLIHLRIRLENLRKLNSGSIIASGIFAYTILKTNQITSEVELMIQKTNELLIFLMDPLEKLKPLQIYYLVKNFDYPDVNLDEIDKEYI